MLGYGRPGVNIGGKCWRQMLWSQPFSKKYCGQMLRGKVGSTILYIKTLDANVGENVGVESSRMKKRWGGSINVDLGNHPPLSLFVDTGYI